MVSTPNRPRTEPRFRINKSGQVTIPASIREKLGVNLGDHVRFNEEEDGTITVLPAQILTAREIAGSFGSMPEGESLEEILREARRFGTVRERYRTGDIFNDRD